MPWAVMVPVSVVEPKSWIWPTAPLPVAVWLPAANSATLAPPGAVVPTFQLAGSVKSVLPPTGCQSKAPLTTLLSTEIVAWLEPAEFAIVTWIVSAAALPGAS